MQEAAIFDARAKAIRAKSVVSESIVLARREKGSMISNSMSVLRVSLLASHFRLYEIGKFLDNRSKP